MAMPTYATSRADMNSSAITAGTNSLGTASLNALSGLLKDVYLPGVTNTLYFDNKFTRMIQSQAGQLDATGRRIINAFETQRSAGVGPMEEGGSFRESVPIDGFQGWEWMKYSNMYVEFTGPAIATVQSGQGSFVDLVESHITSLTKSAQLDLERILTGCGDGRVGKIGQGSTLNGNSTMKVDGPGFFDTQFIEDGMWIEAIAPVVNNTTAVTKRIYATGLSPMQVGSHTTGNRRTATKGTVTVGQTFVNGQSTLTEGDWLTRKDAYGQVNKGASNTNYCLEQNGLCNLVSDGMTEAARGFCDNNGWLPTNEDTDNYLLSWNVSRATQPILKSLSYNVNDELDEENLLTIMIEAENQYQADPNLLMVSPRALLKYFKNVNGDRRFNTMEAMEWTGGYKGLGIQLGDKKLMVTSMNSVPIGIGFLINTNDFKFLRPAGWNGYKWLSGGDGGVLTQKEGSDVKFATAVDYWQFVCVNPGKQCKLYNISEM